MFVGSKVRELVDPYPKQVENIPHLTEYFFAEINIFKIRFVNSASTSMIILL